MWEFPFYGEWFFYAAGVDVVGVPACGVGEGDGYAEGLSGGDGVVVGGDDCGAAGRGIFENGRDAWDVEFWLL